MLDAAGARQPELVGHDWLGFQEGQRPRVSRHDHGSRMVLCCRPELCAGDLNATTQRGVQAGATVARYGWRPAGPGQQQSARVERAGLSWQSESGPLAQANGIQ